MTSPDRSSLVEGAEEAAKAMAAMWNVEGGGRLLSQDSRASLERIAAEFLSRRSRRYAAKVLREVAKDQCQGCKRGDPVTRDTCGPVWWHEFHGLRTGYRCGSGALLERASREEEMADGR